jgi:DNA-binding IclR family transcriptional regulator
MTGQTTSTIQAGAGQEIVPPIRRTFDMAYMAWMASGPGRRIVEKKAANDAARAMSRAFDLLRAIGSNAKGVSTTTLQSQLQIPRASLYRILSSLMNELLVVRQPQSGMLHLGHAALTLGFQARVSTILTHVAAPILRHIARETRQLAEILVPGDHGNLVVLDVWQGIDTPVIVRSRSGSIARIGHGFAPGLVCLAYAPASRVLEYVRRTELARKDPGPATCEDLPQKLERCRQQGFVWLKQSGRPGVGRISAPIFESNDCQSRVKAIIGIACASSELHPERATEWGRLLQECAAKISASLQQPEIDYDSDDI